MLHVYLSLLMKLCVPHISNTFHVLPTIWLSNWWIKLKLKCVRWKYYIHIHNKFREYKNKNKKNHTLPEGQTKSDAILHCEKFRTLPADSNWYRLSLSGSIWNQRHWQSCRSNAEMWRHFYRQLPLQVPVKYKVICYSYNLNVW